jgi:hypothetical protein
MASVASYCTQCGARIEPHARFCPSCGRATPLSASSFARKIVSRDRAILGYIMGILIAGTGHIVVGRVAHGILILGGAVVVGIVTFAISPALWIIAAIAYGVFQIYPVVVTA